MKLIRYDYPTYNDIEKRFENAINNFIQPFSQSFELDNIFTTSEKPKANIYSDKNNFYVKLEIPDVKKQDIDIELENSVLTINYEKKLKTTNSNETKKYSRSIDISDSIDGTKVKASLKNGILTITLPRIEEQKPKKIQIK